MENTTTIRSKIEEELGLGGYTFSSFGQVSGINRGVFSAILNSNPPKPISVRQMDLITKAFDYPEGWLYNLYVDECFYEGKPHWKRIKPFLIRCVEVGNLECVNEVLSRLLEDLAHVPAIFALAEELYEAGKMIEATPFYECVIDNEKYQHSERLAISHYRLFTASIEQDLERSLEYTLRFLPFLNRLPTNYKLDGIHKVINMYFYLHKWDAVEKYGDELWQFAKTVYQHSIQENKGRNMEEALQTNRQLVFYYGYGYLSKSTALQKKELYKEARSYIDCYADLSWFEGLTTEGKADVKQFNMWAKANSYTIDLLLGKMEVLPDYIIFLKQNPEEVLSGLLTILESANKYKFSVDSALEQFSENIEKLESYDDVKHRTYFARFLFQRAKYDYHNKLFIQGTNHVLCCLYLAIIMKNDSDFKQCVTLFESYRHVTTNEQKLKYEKIIKEMNDYEENYNYQADFNYISY